MANEHLKRTHTSSGIYKVATFSLWIKGQTLNTSQQKPIYFYDGSTLFQVFFERSTGTNPGSLVVYSSSTDLRFGGLYRDVSSWMNLVVSVDTTKSEADRISVYLNGSKLDLVGSQSSGTPNYPAANAELLSSVQTINALNGSGAYQVFDYFYVDGQSLTPDVFGFNKDGDGYISVGSTQSTDFRPGQWSPHSPRKIKTEIERKGGFGVNGFYLPMNDSSNVGADFHTTPNSIITLKGEDLPQPRNGAPTTSDAYVSQLRSDPYADNLVLAVPGISTATGANLVTNGTFDTNTTGWTSQDATLSVDNGRIKVLTTNTNYGSALQTVTGLTVGQRYTFQVDMYYGNASLVTAISGASPSINSGWQSADYVWRTSFTATTTSLVIDFQMASQSNVYGFWDNVILKAEDAPRDYSADIKGSGTNKTLTPNGQVGVGYELGNYYGSAMTFDGTTDYLQIPHSEDFNMGTGDFTLECWINSIDDSDYQGIFGSYDYDNAAVLLQISNTGLLRFVNPSAISPTGSSDLQTGQWNHIVMERYNGRLYGYVNGVAEINIAYTSSVDWGHSNNAVVIGVVDRTDYPGQYEYKGSLQDLRLYKGVAKYKGGFDVPKPYTPVGIESWRQVPDTCKNNFSTLNPLASRATHTNGNLSAAPATDVNYSASISNFMVSSGKWYCELRFDEESTGGIISGISELENFGFRDIYGGTNYFGQSIDANDTAGIRFGPVANDGDIISMYMDLDSSPITASYTVNGGSATTYNSNDLTYSYNNLIPGRTYGFVAADGQSAVTGIEFTFNFGQNPTFSGQVTAGTYTDSNGKGLFKYQPPAGYLALCEDNLPTPAIADPGEHFKTVLYTGDGNGGRSVPGVGFKPDLVWVKRRSASAIHFLFDSVRGAGAYLQSSSTAAEGNDPTNTLMSFDSDGFTSGNTNGMNQSTHNYVTWCWKAGGAAVSNSDGSITSQVSVNQTAGFSIVSYTGSSSAITVGHELGKKPNMILFKNRDQADKWAVYHSSVGATKFLSLNESTAATTSSSYFNDTEPTSSVFTVNQTGPVNQNNEKYIAYCWAEIEGFSKFGSYVGNASADGTFVYCGFKPAFVITKRTDGTSNWLIHDSSRDSVNPVMGALYANNSSAEGSAVRVDFVSNGFKHRNADGGTANNYANNYIFIAFAESPFQTANAK